MLIITNLSNIYPSMVPQPVVGPWPIFQSLDLLHSLKGTSDGGSARRKAATYTQDSTNTE
jgi:hypothetical protein